jgi:hypothetical protein
VSFMNYDLRFIDHVTARQRFRSDQNNGRSKRSSFCSLSDH